ncbi:MAG: hypothetical protein C4535_17415 [Comamonadaceae bacterium]|nr:MAG: hypothetical protein C4535_17415 [Comamonadaceae bacterium]
MNHLRELDWKLLFFAFLGCYLIPWLVVGTLVSAIIPADGTAISGWKQVVLNSYLAVYFVAMPLAAGYFTARFSKNRPQLHVLLVVLLGTVAVMFVTSNSLSVQAVLFAASLAVASLGAFVVLRKVPR